MSLAVVTVTSEIYWVVTPCNASFCMRLQVLLLCLFSRPEVEANMFLRNIAFLRTSWIYNLEDITLQPTASVA
jgi:hypothetical protein